MPHKMRVQHVTVIQDKQQGLGVCQVVAIPPMQERAWHRRRQQHGVAEQQHVLHQADQVLLCLQQHTHTSST